MTTVNNNELPSFLRTYGDLRDYLSNELDDKNTTDKGTIFAKFVGNIVPITDIGSRFGELEMGPLSHDGGVDLRSQSADGSKHLYVQSKLTIRSVDDLDLILSKFQSYQSSSFPSGGSQMSFLDQEGPSLTPTVYFVIATLSKVVERILPLYEKSNRPSRIFYDKLKDEGNIEIIDGPKLLPILQSAYRKLHMLPSNVVLRLETSFIRKDHVYIGIISSNELKRCYNDFGDALFLENIRIFLGYSSGRRDKESVNDAIKDTAENEPREMLARNNGINFRARTVEIIDEKTLRLDGASIVNGLQTTRCIVDAAQSEACVLVKITQVDDAWAIAKAANFQNRVEQIALDLARYVRPQAVKLAASRLGVHVDNSGDSLFDVFESIYTDHVRYDEIYYIFMGLFSRKPNNAINKNYTYLREDLLRGLQDSDPIGEFTFNSLFRLYSSSRKAQDVVESRYVDNSYKNIFKRFWRDTKPDYKAMITLLAACGSTRINVFQDNVNFDFMMRFLESLLSLLESDEQKYLRYYQYAFETIATYLLNTNEDKDEVQILRTMFDDLRGANFDNLYRQICMFADGREQ